MCDSYSREACSGLNRKDIYDVRSGRLCKVGHDVTFPLYAKADVNGENTQPLYRWLKENAPGPDGQANVRWNFANFLVGRDGRVIARFDPRITPEALEPELEAALG
jgi:glutathione peroxidase